MGESAIVVVLMMTLSIVGGALLFGWVSDQLEQRFPNRGRIMLVWTGLIVSLPVVVLLVGSDGNNVSYLIILGILYGLGRTASGDSVMWPMIQGIIRPELRGSGRALINMTKGIAAALMLTGSGWVADQVGVATMLLYVIPGPLFLSIILWLPLFRTYQQDREALHHVLHQRRSELLGESR